MKLTQPDSNVRGSKTPGYVVGVVSDTHGLIRPEALQLLRGSDVIIHCGDVGAPGVLDSLRATVCSPTLRRDFLSPFLSAKRRQCDCGQLHTKTQGSGNLASAAWLGPANVQELHNRSSSAVKLLVGIRSFSAVRKRFAARPCSVAHAIFSILTVSSIRWSGSRRRRGPRIARLLRLTAVPHEANFGFFLRRTGSQPIQLRRKLHDSEPRCICPDSSLSDLEL